MFMFFAEDGHMFRVLRTYSKGLELCDEHGILTGSID